MGDKHADRGANVTEERSESVQIGRPLDTVEQKGGGTGATRDKG